MNSVTDKTRLVEKRKTKKSQQNYKRKKNMSWKKRRKLIRRQTESNKEIKQNEKRQKRENMVEDIDISKFFELATTNKKYVNGLNLHEIKSEVFGDYTGEFVLIGSLLIGELDQKTKIRFKNINDFEIYINAIDNGGYDSEDVIFT